ncbi:hypothetical protein QBC34DRAFT_389266 [Podospora aff. communis PSN243]|uniref:YMC020W-like alpha/beta hydrolase domain-containing protein n=1 Tax=Podospora aff. communis PSN243 TaxID=3040156 RepID=A0AAV9H7D1_9PEZI|nr:hypothetical protein QBC34DRAFT_389266 [Podospora aff. communis PSN243]
MGPRKRAKLHPAVNNTPASPTTMASQPSDPAGSSAQPSQSPSIPINAASSSTAAPTPQGTPQHSLLSHSPIRTEASSVANHQIHKTRSWYGSWPRKSSASTQVARETILGGTVKSKTTADFSRFSTKKDPDAMSIDDTSGSAPVLPGIYEAPEVSATATQEPAPQEAGDQEAGDAMKPKKPEEEDTKADVPASFTSTQADLGGSAESTLKPPVSSGWLGGWFGRPVNTPQTTLQTNEVKPDESPKAPERHQVAPKPDGDETTLSASNTQPGEAQQPHPEPEAPSQTTAEERPSTATGGSWFGFWSSGTATTTKVDATAPVPPLQVTPPEEPSQPAKPFEDVVMEDAPPADAAPAPPPKAGSTWAFWSRDTRATSTKSSEQPEAGQLAVMGESSETHPKRANSMEFKATPPKEPSLKSIKKDDQVKGAATASREASGKQSKRARPLSMATDEITDSRPSTPKNEPPSKPEPSQKPAGSKTPSAVKTSAPNLLLPSFGKTYRQKDNPSVVQQITQLILRTRQKPTKHVFLTKEPPKIKKALAIGIHGLYPANYLRSVIGQPTGTSIKFANHSAEAIRRWTDSHGCEECEIEKVALEGEGKIGERVENLWRLLLNWIDHIRKADLIMIGCHSQGVPVSIMLLAKLIELGIITTAKIGICAMAGVSLGPFPDYRSSMGMLMGTAAELWEFADPQSEVSKRLEASIKVVLSYGTRITYVGSMDDQLVPLESAIYAPAHHPYIYRAVFIDSRIHAPDFIAHLVGFALKLRNLGVSDHGLVRELSTSLAGSLYSGEGHSRLYDDEQVYDLAVTHALETTDVGNVACEVHQRQSLSNPNPYHLPWIMRGLLEEDFVRTELNSETAELLRQFDDWKPVTKALKDVKYRLEAVRSKL